MRLRTWNRYCGGDFEVSVEVALRDASLDYTLVQRPWRNSTKDSETITDPFDSDHQANVNILRRGKKGACGVGRPNADL